MKIASLTPAEFFSLLDLSGRQDAWKKALDAQLRDYQIPLLRRH